MGSAVDQDEFTDAELTRFKERLPDQVIALERLLARPRFGRGERTVGAELELFLIDERGHPLPICLDVLEDVDDPTASAEIDGFEIEIGTKPVALGGRPFTRLARDIGQRRKTIEAAARDHGARTVAVGVLPTLRRSDLDCSAVTPLPRYRALTSALRERRGAPFQISIDGDDPLDIVWENAAMEGANTAFQLHLRVEPDEFASVFNAALLAAGPALAASGNSPTFLGHRLWEETRVALFKQAGDTRSPERDRGWRQPSRMSFGTGWMRDGAAEQFRESIALHEPLLALRDDEDALDCVARGGVPRLAELRLHHGTVWYWNRAVYDPGDDGHVRLEMRALPAGPTDIDMLASGAFLIGLALDLAPESAALLPAFPFACAERNFYRAAQHGLAAEMLWPPDPSSAPEPIVARDLLPALIDRARRGLASAGVDAREIDDWLEPFAARVATGITGARWQRQALEAIESERKLGRPAAIEIMLEHYARNAATGSPVHTWPRAA